MSKVTLAVIFLCLFLSNILHAQTIDSKKVENFLMEAEAAGRWLAAGEEDLARMEAALEPGFLELETMVSGYHKPDLRTNAFLRKRGWGHLVWTQLMYRLLAIRNGVYERELDFAEHVALASVSREALSVVEQSVERIFTLLEAKEKFGLSEELDGFARGLFAEGAGSGDYLTLVADFRDRFRDRRDVVLARLESGERTRLIDPASLPPGTAYAADYERLRQRLQGNDRLTEIFDTLVGYDAGRIEEMVAALEASASPVERTDLTNRARIALLRFEEALVATERDSAVQDLLDLCARRSHQAFNPYEGCDTDFRDVMLLVHVAQRKLAAYASPEALRDFHQVAQLVR